MWCNIEIGGKYLSKKKTNVLLGGGKGTKTEKRGKEILKCKYVRGSNKKKLRGVEKEAKKKINRTRGEREELRREV